MLMGVVSHCHVVVANDSGALHLAGGLGVPVVGIWGPTDERYSTPVTPHEDGRTVASDFGIGVLPPLFSGRLSDRSPLHEANSDRAGARCRPPVSPGEPRVSQRAVFLDRDGTMIEDVGYLDRLERLKLFPYTIDAVRLLNRAGYKVVVVTSQNGVAQGMLTEEFLARGARACVAAVRSGGREDRGLLLLPAFDARSCRALPHRLRMPQTEARYDTGGRAGPFARPVAVVRRRRSMARHRDGAECRHQSAAGGNGLRQDRSGRGVRRNIPPVPVAGTLIEATSWILRNT